MDIFQVKVLTFGRPEPFMIQELMTRFNITDPGNKLLKSGDSKMIFGRNKRWLF